MLWLVRASRKSSIPTRARSSPARPSPARSPATASRSVWMAKEPGGTTCSLSGCGAASNTRRCICGPTKPSARPAPRSADISISTMAADRIRALTTPHQIKPTSTSRHSAWRPNQGRRSTYRRGESVQTSGTSSQVRREHSRNVRARSNQPHVALDDIDQLRNFIDTVFPQDLADRGSSAMPPHPLLHSAHITGVHPHGAEFIDLERPVAIPVSALEKQHRLLRADLNRLSHSPHHLLN